MSGNTGVGLRPDPTGIEGRKVLFGLQTLPTAVEGKNLFTPSLIFILYFDLFPLVVFDEAPDLALEAHYPRGTLPKTLRGGRSLPGAHRASTRSGPGKEWGRRVEWECVSSLPQPAGQRSTVMVTVDTRRR